MPAVRDQVFISYSHKDREWLSKLQTMLKPLVRNKTISVYLSVSYNGEPHEVKITEEMTRKLYESFRPYPLNPKPVAVPTIKWSKDGTLGKSTKDHGYYKIRKEYVWRHLNRLQTEESRRSIQRAYHGKPAKLKS
jgi:hypothetical protein